MEETIVRIRPQDASLFSVLDPFERLEMLSMPNHFALATIERDGQGEVIPAGLMVAHTMDDTLCINWLLENCLAIRISVVVETIPFNPFFAIPLQPLYTVMG